MHAPHTDFNYSKSVPLCNTIEFCKIGMWIKYIGRPVLYLYRLWLFRIYFIVKRRRGNVVAGTIN